MAHGYFGQDPELSYFQDGTAVVNFSIAVTKKWKDKETKEIKQKTEWPRFVATGRQAEVIAEYFKKGSEIVITDSELRTRNYDHKDGYKVYITELMLKPGGFDFCGKGNGSGNSDRADQQQQAYSSDNQPPKKNEDFDDDIPF